MGTKLLNKRKHMSHRSLKRIYPLQCWSFVGMNPAHDHTRRGCFPVLTVRAYAKRDTLIFCKPKGMQACRSMNHRIAVSPFSRLIKGFNAATSADFRITSCVRKMYMHFSWWKKLIESFKTNSWLSTASLNWQCKIWEICPASVRFLTPRAFVFLCSFQSKFQMT